MPAGDFNLNIRASYEIIRAQGAYKLPVTGSYPSFNHSYICLSLYKDIYTGFL